MSKRKITPINNILTDGISKDHSEKENTQMENTSQTKIINKKYKKKETENYAFLYEGINNKDFQKRVKYSFEFYIKKTNLYDILGKVLSILGIVLPAFATFLTVIGTWQWLIALITTLSTIASGLFAYLKCSDKQNTYRMAAENIKAELIAYLTELGDYKNTNAKEDFSKDDLLFTRIENIIQQGYLKISALEKNSKDSKD